MAIPRLPNGMPRTYAALMHLMPHLNWVEDFRVRAHDFGIVVTFYAWDSDDRLRSYSKSFGRRTEQAHLVDDVVSWEVEQVRVALAEQAKMITDPSASGRPGPPSDPEP